MRTKLKLQILSSLLAVTVCVTYSCKKKDKQNVTTEPSETTFDRQAMLVNIGNSIILPAYQNLAGACAKLDSLVTDFNSAPDNTKLLNLQAGFKAAYKSWQSASCFGFGPADDGYLSQNMDTFPTDTTKIEANISSGSYNLDALANLAAKGLPAMDYLLFGTGDAASVLARYTTDANATNRKQYLAALSTAIRTNCSNVLSAWANYMTTFKNATGTDVGSSLGQLINGVDEDLDGIKNYKLGIPLGKQSMGTIYPSKTEAFYCGISAQLILLHITAMQNIYLGKGSQGDGLGLDDYLISKKIQYNGGLLSDAIKAQFLSAIAKIQLVQDPMSAAITNNATSVNAAYIEVQKLLVLLKTDMPSSLGVLITYEDNDGD